jgi:hypothetical protein
MASWRVARSLSVFHAQCRPLAPGAPASSFGTIGDVLHDSTSDHAAKWLWDPSIKLVTAADIPEWGSLHPRIVLDNIRRSRDPRVKYGISRGEMFSSYSAHGYDPFVWRPYSGSDGHFGHGHLSVVGDPRADDVRPWSISSSVPAPAPEPEDPMLKTVLINLAGRATWWVKEPDRPLRVIRDEWALDAYKAAGAVVLPAAPSAEAIANTFGPEPGPAWNAVVSAIHQAG